MERDEGKEMPLSVAFIRVFSVVMILIGVAQFIISGLLLDASSRQNIGGIYFAVTALCSGLWGICMVEGVRQFNMLTLLLFINCVCAIVGVVYAGIALYVAKRIEACSEFDPEGTIMPRCVDDEHGTYANFTCYGNEAYFLEAAQCGARNIDGGSSTKNDCGCVYVDGGVHCKDFGGYADCNAMDDVLPSLSLGSYVLGYACLSLSVFLIVCSCIASCFHSKRRGLMSISAEELRRTAPPTQQARQQQQQGIRMLGGGFRVLPSSSAAAAATTATSGPRTVQMVRVSASPEESAPLTAAGTATAAPTVLAAALKADATRSPAQAARKHNNHHKHHAQQQQK